MNFIINIRGLATLDLSSVVCLVPMLIIAAVFILALLDNLQTRANIANAELLMQQMRVREQRNSSCLLTMMMLFVGIPLLLGFGVMLLVFLSQQGLAMQRQSSGCRCADGL